MRLAIQVIIATLTANEQAVLRSLYHNHYGDKGDGVWSWAVNDSSVTSGLEGKSLSGVIGSLVKKGLYRSEEYDKGEDVLWQTDLGRAVVSALSSEFETGLGVFNK